MSEYNEYVWAEIYNQIGNEYQRVSEVSHNAVQVIEDIDRQFEKTVKLNGTDVTFLFFATALQFSHQIPEISFHNI